MADGVYHVTARGTERSPIYLDDADRSAFVRRLDRVIDRFGWRCLDFCLMPNHLHLLVRTPQPNLPRGAQQLIGGYAQWFNRRHERIGPLFAGRYGAVLVQRDAHLLEILRYIALNPVRAGLVGDATRWRWGGHAAILGHRRPEPFLAVEEVHELFAAQGAADGARAYAEFVAATGETRYAATGAAFGDAGFLRSVLPDSRPYPDVPVAVWGPGRPPLADLLGDRSSESALRAYRVHGYTMPEIATVLGCHVATVSRRVADVERRSA